MLEQFDRILAEAMNVASRIRKSDPEENPQPQIRRLRNLMRTADAIWAVCGQKKVSLWERKSFREPVLTDIAEKTVAFVPCQHETEIDILRIVIEEIRKHDDPDRP